MSINAHECPWMSMNKIFVVFVEFTSMYNYVKSSPTIRTRHPGTPSAPRTPKRTLCSHRQAIAPPEIAPTPPKSHPFMFPLLFPYTRNVSKITPKNTLKHIQSVQNHRKKHFSFFFMSFFVFFIWNMWTKGITLHRHQEKMTPTGQAQVKKRDEEGKWWRRRRRRKRMRMRMKKRKRGWRDEEKGKTQRKPYNPKSKKPKNLKLIQYI